MKSVFALIVILLTTTVSGKDIPTPFWYSITRTILSETQDYMMTSDFMVDQNKFKARKDRGHSNVPLLCNQKKNLFQLPFLKLKSDPLFATSE